MKNNANTQEILNNVTKPFHERVHDYLEKSGYYYVDKNGNPAKRSGNLHLQEIADILKMNTGLMNNCYYNPDSGLTSISNDFYLDDEKVLHMIAGGWGSVSTTTVRLLFDRLGLPASKDNVTDACSYVIQSNNRSRAFLIKLRQVVSRGHYDPNVYKTVMVDWLHARPEIKDDGTADYSYPIWWLKSLMTAIYSAQIYQDDKLGLEGFSHIPNRYMVFGPQGIGKSSFFDLVSFKLKYDFNGNLDGHNSNDIWRNISSSVLVNMDDKAYSSKISLNDSIKSAISQNTVTFRVPYAVDPVTRPQRAVWVASTNRFNVYTDKTGDRREYPLDLGWKLNKKQSEEVGIKYFKDPNMLNQLDQSPLQANLWFTFIKDYEENKFNPILEPTNPLYDVRHRYYAEHSMTFDAELAIDQLMHKSIPTNFFNMYGYDKNNKVAYLSDETYRGVTPQTAKDNLPQVSAFKELRAFDIINAPIFNSAVRQLSEKRTSVQQITNILHEQYGFNAKRTATGQIYIKA